MGFGVLRAIMDLFRGYFFGTGELNIPAARERVIREISSIMTDNVSSGVAAAGLGALLATRYGKLSNTFASFDSVELVRDLAQKSSDPKTFVQKLAQSINPKKAAQLEKPLQAVISGKLASGQAAESIAKTLGQKQFDVTLDKTRFVLPELLDDVGELVKGIGEKAAGKNWQQTALTETSRILKIKKLKLTCLAVGAVSTVAVPFINRWMTQRIDKIDYYPGEIGLKGPALNTPARNAGLQLSTTPIAFGNTATRTADSPFAQFKTARQTLTPANTAPQDKRGKREKLFPYVSRELKEGNITPLLLTLAPLPFAFGLFNTTARRFVNPFKKGFTRYLRNAYDFGKGFPFTTQQQMASLFALLISSRLAGSRSKNEFRERLVDSGLGWAVWILGTPILKKGVAALLEKRTGSQLLKTVGKQQVVKNRSEIERLMTGALKQKTLKQFIWLGAGSTIVSMITLGIIEPLIGILLTKKSAENAAAKLNA